jgi:hypothetical protein
MSNQVIEEIYNELYKKATTRTKSSLKLLKSACDSQVSRKAKDFTYATIGLITSELGGIKTQAIRNKTGKHFRNLIDAYSAVYSREKPKNLSDDPLSWLNQIEDAAIRYQVLDLFAENKRLRNELNLLKANTVIDIDMRVSSSPNPDSIMLENKLDDIELKALTHFISETNLKNFGWKLGTNGRLIDARGKSLTKVGFIDAIEKLATIPSDNDDK